MGLSLLLLLLAGCIAGFLAGFFGVGGGIILVPILLYYFHVIDISSLVATHLAFGTSLLIVIFASIPSAYEHNKNGNVLWKAVVIMGVASVVGSFVGGTVAASLEGKVLQQIFASVVTIAAIRLLIEQKGSKRNAQTNLSPIGLGSIGMIVGLVSSLAGVGGGVFSIPMMYYFMKFPLKRALGTSSATIVITAVASTIVYVVNGWNAVDVYAPQLASYTAGYVNYVHSIPIIIGTVPMAKLGASVAQKTHADNLRRFYAVFLLAIAMKMFFF
ncbi:MAG: sulfite exporter TauE/SafE family protein [Bacteroidota bacterium]